MSQDEVARASRAAGQARPRIDVDLILPDLPGRLIKLLEELRCVKLVTRAARIVRAQGETVRFGKPAAFGWNLSMAFLYMPAQSILP